MTRSRFLCISAGLTLLISGCAANLTAPEIEVGHPAHANTTTSALPADELHPLGENPFSSLSSEKNKSNTDHQNHGGNR